MADRPLVSVVVLNYNGERIIAACVDRLLGQTYPRVEVVVVDNCSTDASLEILSRYEARGHIRLVRSPANRGCPGGRNLGLTAARGEIIAFMDDDGYASPTWLEETVQVLLDDPDVGAVAPLVFFNQQALILNGAGGTLNLRGYGGDFCFEEPYEFATLPRHVLYPMGCGMVVRRSVLDAMDGFDEALFNYYDDVEVGFWTWRLGQQVVVAPDAWVDHDFGSSETINRNKVLLCERNRIRTVLKYYPLRLLPAWLAREFLSLFHFRSDGMWKIPYRAWAWNMAHLGDTLRRRRRYGAAPATVRRLLFPTWGQHPPPGPVNHLNRPDPERAGPIVAFDRAADASQLHYGWYPVEHDRDLSMRWTAAVASTFVRVPPYARDAVVTWRAAHTGQLATLRLRPLGDSTPLWQVTNAPAPDWQTLRFPCTLPSGVYELQLETVPLHASGDRGLGVGIARLALE